MRLLFDTTPFSGGAWCQAGRPRRAERARRSRDGSLLPRHSLGNRLESQRQGFDFHLPPTGKRCCLLMRKKHHIKWLPITPGHCRRFQDQPFHHKDPSDHMPITQALVENLTVIGCDDLFDAWGVAWGWWWWLDRLRHMQLIQRFPRGRQAMLFRLMRPSVPSSGCMNGGRQRRRRR